MENQLEKVATRTTKKKLGEVYDDATWLLVEHKDSLSANEFNYILEMINSHAVPTPKLLIKDHKKPLKNGDPLCETGGTWEKSMCWILQCWVQRAEEDPGRPRCQLL